MTFADCDRHEEISNENDDDSIKVMEWNFSCLLSLWGLVNFLKTYIKKAISFRPKYI